MTIPATVAVGFEILMAVREGDLERASRRATKVGSKRLARALKTPDDPLGGKMRAWDGVAQSRVRGNRALCRFGTHADGRVAVLDLRLGRDGWRVDDVLLLECAAYEDYGVLDEGPSNVIG